jgi:energy-coupling factor transporter ATP-binding protein EcfA2
MRIRHVKISNFRGIWELSWAPGTGVNCLIGPGDSTKTTILDAIELALTPRSFIFADDSDFYNLDVEHPVEIKLTLGDLPPEFIADNRYGMYLRGWDIDAEKIFDEPSEELEDVLSICVMIDKSLEAKWSIFNERIAASDNDPPMIRYKDMCSIAPSRLGPFAEKHLGWGRQSILGQMEESNESLSHRLADASRAARHAFQNSGDDVFKDTVARVEKLGKEFSVPVRNGYRAELDIQSVNISSGGIALHDGNLPLRRLGTGSGRMLVSALQRDASSQAHVALVDEIEHGLEPHRIARLLNYLKQGEKDTGSSQIFLTTHSPVVIRELTATDICTVRSVKGVTTVKSVSGVSAGFKKIQGYLRVSPEAFLANRVLIGEGKTECGLLRGLDKCWIDGGKDSYAYQGVVAIDGGGKDRAPQVGESLLELGYGVALLLDSDKEPNAAAMEGARSIGGSIFQWEEKCSTEERIFLDVPWLAVGELVKFAAQETSSEGVLKRINDACEDKGLQPLQETKLSNSLDTVAFRQALGAAAKFEDKEKKKKAWFKDIARAETVAGIIAPYLNDISETSLARCINSIRDWIDGRS